MKKSLALAFLIIMSVFALPNFFIVSAETDKTKASSDTNSSDSLESIISKQYEQSQASEVIDALPEKSKNALEKMGIKLGDGFCEAFSVKGFFEVVFKTFSEAVSNDGIGISQLIGIIILCALANALKGGLNTYSELIEICAAVFICLIISTPVISLINEAENIIGSVSNFMLVYIPVMAGLLIAAGQGVTGGSYYTVMMTSCQLITQICYRFILPLINIFFGMSIVSSLSKGINIEGICSVIYRLIKWILGLIMGIFSSILTLSSIVTAASDSASSRAFRFAVRSFVPIVGNALSEAYLSFMGCVGVLKTGVGVIAMLGTAVTFLPVISKAVFWTFLVTVCGAVGEIFELKGICKLLTSCEKVLKVISALLLCIMVMFVLASAIVLLVGGKNG